MRVFNLFIIANHILAEIRWVTLPRPSFACQFKGQGDIHDFCFLKIIQDKTRAEKGKSTCAIAQIRPRSPRGRLQARARQVVSSSPRKNQNLLQLSSFVKNCTFLKTQILSLTADFNHQPCSPSSASRPYRPLAGALQEPTSPRPPPPCRRPAAPPPPSPSPSSSGREPCLCSVVC